jgi:hypothetical protein
MITKATLYNLPLLLRVIFNYAAGHTDFVS